MRDVAVLLISIHHPCTFGDADLQHVRGVEVALVPTTDGGAGESDTVAGISVCPSALTLPHSRSPLSWRTPETIALPSKLFGVLVIVARACSGRWVGGVLLSLSPPISRVSTVFQRSRLQSSFRAAPCRVIVYPNGAFFTCFSPGTTEIQLLLME